MGDGFVGLRFEYAGPGLKGQPLGLKNKIYQLISWSWIKGQPIHQLIHNIVKENENIPSYFVLVFLMLDGIFV